MKKVSIIIPVYKAENTLSRCIQSCINQTYRNIEIILIDDGSPDNSGIICNKYAETDNRIKVLHQQNNGVSIARNNGIAISTGDYITFVDSDDWIEPDTVNNLLAAQQNGEYDIVVFGHYRHIGDSVKKMIPPSNIYCKNKEDIANALLSRSSMELFRSPCGKLFKRNVIISNDLKFDKNLSLGEDFKFVLNYLEKVNTCAMLKEALNHFVISLSHDKQSRYGFFDIDHQWRHGLEAHQNYKSFFIKNNLYQKYRFKIETHFLDVIKTFLYTSFSANSPKKEVIKKLSSIVGLENYNTLKMIPLRIVDDSIEKVVLVTVKYKAWHLLYFAYFLKYQLYNKKQVSKVMK